MKLLIAIINNDDCPTVLSEITKGGFSATKLLIGVDDDKVDALIEIIGKFSCKRKQIIQTSTTFNAEFFTSMPVEVNVGGATVFVVDVDKFVKL